MSYISKLLERHNEKIRHYEPVRIIEEFSKWTEKELDFLWPDLVFSQIKRLEI